MYLTAHHKTLPPLKMPGTCSSSRSSKRGSQSRTELRNPRRYMMSLVPPPEATFLPFQASPSNSLCIYPLLPTLQHGFNDGASLQREAQGEHEHDKKIHPNYPRLCATLRFSLAVRQKERLTKTISMSVINAFALDNGTLKRFETRHQ